MKKFSKWSYGLISIVIAAVVAVSAWLLSVEDEPVREDLKPRHLPKGRVARNGRSVPANAADGSGRKASASVKNEKPAMSKVQPVVGKELVVSEEKEVDGITVVIDGEEEPQRALATPGLTPAVMRELSEVFAQVAASDLTDTQFVQAMQCYKPSVVLGAVGSIMKCGTSEEKGNALLAVGMLFGKESSTGIPYETTHPKREIAIGDDGVESVAPAAERPTQELVSTLSAGLSDADAEVRDTAFSVMRLLPEEESGILAANLMSGGDVGLQERLMREAGNESNVRLSLMGMGSENQEVRNLAVENLKNVAGREFASQQEAAEWYEAHHAEFPQVEGKTLKQGAVNQKE